MFRRNRFSLSSPLAGVIDFPPTGLLRLRLLMTRLKALGLRPEGSNGAIGVFGNLSLNKLPLRRFSHAAAHCYHLSSAQMTTFGGRPSVALALSPADDSEYAVHRHENQKAR